MNKDLLKGEIRAKAMTQDVVAERIGVSRSRFNAKLNGHKGAEFTLGEVRAMKKLLYLSKDQVDEIFFDEKVS